MCLLRDTGDWERWLVGWGKGLGEEGCKNQAKQPFSSAWRGRKREGKESREGDRNW